MAKTKEIHFHVSRKLGDGDYGSMEVSVGEVASAEPGETFNEAFNEVKERVKKKFNREMRDLLAHLEKD